MNFDDIKSKMDKDSEELQLPNSLGQLKDSQLPISRIRKKMKSEIIGQLLVMVIFITAPLIDELYPLPRTVYVLFIGLIILITLGYLVKMILFLRTTNDLGIHTKDALCAFIHEFKLTMEVYKVAVISSSLLLPFPALAFLLGQVDKGNQELFNQWFLMQVPTSDLLTFLGCYLLAAAFIYFITVKWVKGAYGNHLRDVENALQDLAE